MANYPYYQQYQYPRQIQNNGIIMVRDESEARNYPVGLGNRVTFINENNSYIYTKTMGFSQLEPPVFEKYKKEVVEETVVEDNGYTDLKKMVDDLIERVNAIEKPTKRTVKKEVAEDE